MPVPARRDCGSGAATAAVAGKNSVWRGGGEGGGGGSGGGGGRKKHWKNLVATRTSPAE